MARQGAKARSLIPALAPPAVLGLMLAVWSFKIVRQMENVTVDWRFEARVDSDPAPDPRILIVGIGEPSLEIAGRWPWPRDTHAQLLRFLAERGPAAIVFDLLFTEHSQIYGDDQTLVEQLEIFPNALTGAMTDPNGETFQGESIGKTLPFSRITGDISSLEGSDTAVLPIQPIAEAAWTGFVNSDPSEVDGVRWRVPLVVRLGEKVFPTLPLQTLMRLENVRPEDVEIVIGEQVRFSTRDGADLRLIPIDESGQMRINYRNFDGFAVAEYANLFAALRAWLAGETEWPESNPPIQDQILLIGQTAAGLTDFGPTPHNPNTALVYVQAAALNNLLQNDFLHLAPAWPILLGWLVLAWLTLWLLRKAPVTLGVVVPLLVVVGYVLAAFYVFQSRSLQIPLFLPVIGFIGVHGAALIDRLLTEIRAKSRIKGMFGTYVSPEIVDQMVESEEDPKLGGENCEITAFFSDIQSFSSFSELLSAEQLVSLLNEYLTPMTEILWYNHGGTLDKYIGDAIVGMFGAPLPYDDHAHRGCLAAIEMQAEQADLRKKWKRDGGWPEVVHRMQTRIGLNTGEAVIGNMGSPRRFNYTMMGDSVNLAARCESGAKSYGVYSMVTEDTHRQSVGAKDDIAFRYLDQLVVKGRSKPVKMYEVIGLKSELGDKAADCLSLFASGMEKYLAQDWDGARKEFERSAELEAFQPDNTELEIVTNPSLVMADRCPQMKHSPPGDDWDGVYVMKTK